MGVLTTKEAPNFTAQAVLPSGEIADLTLSSYRGTMWCSFSIRSISPSSVRPRSSPSTSGW